MKNLKNPKAGAILFAGSGLIWLVIGHMSLADSPAGIFAYLPGVLMLIVAGLCLRNKVRLNRLAYAKLLAISIYSVALTLKENGTASQV